MLNNFFSKSCQKCFFYQDNSCVLSKSLYLPCDMKVQKIRGVTNIEFYVNYVTAKHLSRRAFYFSLLALVVSFLALIVNVMKKFPDFGGSLG